MTHHVSRFFCIPRRALHLAAVITLLCSAGLAQAQYMWVDAKGVKQFSDQPPPPSVPVSRILKAPKGQPSVQNSADDEAAAAAAAAASASLTPAAASKGPANVAEREADYVKRRKEKAEQDRKEHEEKSNRMAQADNCERTRAAKSTLDAGTRISVTDKNGERAVMDDQQRAAEVQRLEKILAGCKS